MKFRLLAERRHCVLGCYWQTQQISDCQEPRTCYALPSVKKRICKKNLKKHNIKGVKESEECRDQYKVEMWLKKQSQILDSLRLFSQHLSQMPHFWGCEPGGYDPKIQTQPRYLYNAPTPKFHHPTFTRSEVIVLTNKHTNPQTNKQTPLKRFNVLCYAKKLGNK